jgi:hypothetical protein
MGRDRPELGQNQPQMGRKPPNALVPKSPGDPRSATAGKARGETLSFDLLLFGQAVELHAYAILAVQRVAAVPRRRDPARPWLVPQERSVPLV